MPKQQRMDFKVLAPLTNFNWDGDSFSISNLCTIRKFGPDEPDLSYFKHYLSDADEERFFYSSHWLSFNQLPDDKLNPDGKIKIFLLALWLVVPTRTQVKFRFEFPDKSGCPSIPVRYSDQFQWIRNHFEDKIKTKYLEEMSDYIDNILLIYNAQKRLCNSLILTFRACTTISWQTAFICFSAAAEGILTYSDRFGTTRRLAKSFACLTKTTTSDRDNVYRAFVDSYKIRSDIMHGRAYHLKNDDLKFKELANFSQLLRELWKVVLSSKITIAKLEKPDADRQIWLNHIERHYSPPKRTV